MKILFMGTPEFAVPILEALNERYEVSLVVSQPNREKKKGVYLDTPVASKAKELGLNLIQPEKIMDSFDDIINSGADTLITAAYGQYLPTKILNSFKCKVNVHGSILPLHRGGAPIQRCLMNGDTKTGVTIMEMAKKLDAGKIFGIKEYVIEKDDDASILFDKLSIIGRDLLLELIDDIYSGKNQGVEQDDSKSTYSKNIEPEEERIDLNETSKSIVNKIRGLSKNPGAYLEVGSVKLKVFKAEEVSYNGSEAPGTVLDIKKKIMLKTKDSAITLELVLMPGKKIISGKDFSNGQKIFVLNSII